MQGTPNQYSGLRRQPLSLTYSDVIRRERDKAIKAGADKKIAEDLFSQTIRDREILRHKTSHALDQFKSKLNRTEAVLEVARDKLAKLSTADLDERPDARSGKIELRNSIDTVIAERDAAFQKISELETVLARTHLRNSERSSERELMVESLRDECDKMQSQIETLLNMLDEKSAELLRAKESFSRSIKELQSEFGEHSQLSKSPFTAEDFASLNTELVRNSRELGVEKEKVSLLNRENIALKAVVEEQSRKLGKFLSSSAHNFGDFPSHDAPLALQSVAIQTSTFSTAALASSSQIATSYEGSTPQLQLIIERQTVEIEALSKEIQELRTVSQSPRGPESPAVVTAVTESPTVVTAVAGAPPASSAASDTTAISESSLQRSSTTPSVARSNAASADSEADDIEADDMEERRQRQLTELFSSIHKLTVANDTKAQELARLSDQLQHTSALLRASEVTKQDLQASLQHLSIEKAQGDAFRSQLEAARKDDIAKLEAGDALRRDLEDRLTFANAESEALIEGWARAQADRMEELRKMQAQLDDKNARIQMLRSSGGNDLSMSMSMDAGDLSMSAAKLTESDFDISFVAGDVLSPVDTKKRRGKGGISAAGAEGGVVEVEEQCHIHMARLRDCQHLIHAEAVVLGKMSVTRAAGLEGVAQTMSSAEVHIGTLMRQLVAKMRETARADEEAQRLRSQVASATKESEGLRAIVTDWADLPPSSSSPYVNLSAGFGRVSSAEGLSSSAVTSTEEEEEGGAGQLSPFTSSARRDREARRLSGAVQLVADMISPVPSSTSPSAGDAETENQAAALDVAKELSSLLSEKGRELEAQLTRLGRKLQATFLRIFDLEENLERAVSLEQQQQSQSQSHLLADRQAKVGPIDAVAAAARVSSRADGTGGVGGTSGPLGGYSGEDDDPLLTEAEDVLLTMRDFMRKQIDAVRRQSISKAVEIERLMTSLDVIESVFQERLKRAGEWKALLEKLASLESSTNEASEQSSDRQAQAQHVRDKLDALKGEIGEVKAIYDSMAESKAALLNTVGSSAGVLAQAADVVVKLNKAVAEAKDSVLMREAENLLLEKELYERRVQQGEQGDTLARAVQEKREVEASRAAVEDRLHETRAQLQALRAQLTVNVSSVGPKPMELASGGLSALEAAVSPVKDKSQHKSETTSYAEPCAIEATTTAQLHGTDDDIGVGDGGDGGDGLEADGDDDDVNNIPVLLVEVRDRDRDASTALIASSLERNTDSGRGRDDGAGDSEGKPGSGPRLVVKPLGGASKGAHTERGSIDIFDAFTSIEHPPSVNSSLQSSPIQAVSCTSAVVTVADEGRGQDDTGWQRECERLQSALEQLQRRLDQATHQLHEREVADAAGATITTATGSAQAPTSLEAASKVSREGDITTSLSSPAVRLEGAVGWDMTAAAEATAQQQAKLIALAGVEAVQQEADRRIAELEKALAATIAEGSHAQEYLAGVGVREYKMQAEIHNKDLALCDKERDIRHLSGQLQAAQDALAEQKERHSAQAVASAAMIKELTEKLEALQQQSENAQVQVVDLQRALSVSYDGKASPDEQLETVLDGLRGLEDYMRETMDAVKRTSISKACAVGTHIESLSVVQSHMMRVTAELAAKTEEAATKDMRAEALLRQRSQLQAAFQDATLQAQRFRQQADDEMTELRNSYHAAQTSLEELKREYAAKSEEAMAALEDRETLHIYVSEMQAEMDDLTEAYMAKMAEVQQEYAALSRRLSRYEPHLFSGPPPSPPPSDESMPFATESAQDQDGITGAAATIADAGQVHATTEDAGQVQAASSNNSQIKKNMHLTPTSSSKSTSDFFALSRTPRRTPNRTSGRPPVPPAARFMSPLTPAAAAVVAAVRGASARKWIEKHNLSSSSTATSELGLGGASACTDLDERFVSAMLQSSGGGAGQAGKSVSWGGSVLSPHKEGAGDGLIISPGMSPVSFPRSLAERDDSDMLVMLLGSPSSSYSTSQNGPAAAAGTTAGVSRTQLRVERANAAVQAQQVSQAQAYVVKLQAQLKETKRALNSRSALTAELREKMAMSSSHGGAVVSGEDQAALSTALEEVGRLGDEASKCTQALAEAQRILNRRQSALSCALQELAHSTCVLADQLCQDTTVSAAQQSQVLVRDDGHVHAGVSGVAAAAGAGDGDSFSQRGGSGRYEGEDEAVSVGRTSPPTSSIDKQLRLRLTAIRAEVQEQQSQLSPTTKYSEQLITRLEALHGDLAGREQEVCNLRTRNEALERTIEVLRMQICEATSSSES